MEEKKLPPRLHAIAQWVPTGAKLGDVGTDHALLPLWLLKTGRIVHAVATDINELPLKRAQSNAAAAGEERIRFVLCDGLTGVSSDEVDTIVIAGLGGENIVDILCRSPWVCEDGKTLILQPMSRTECLCSAFSELGLNLEKEQLVEDSGRIYPIFCVKKGKMSPWRKGEFYTGPFSLIADSPLFVRFLSEQKRRLSSAVNGLRQSGRDDKRLGELALALYDIETILKEHEL